MGSGPQYEAVKAGKVKFILVFRELRRDGQWVSYIWQGKDRNYALTAMKNYFVRTSYTKRIKWTDQSERYVLDHYLEMTKTELADQLRSKFKQPFTKNAVIKKWHTLQKGIKP